MHSKIRAIIGHVKGSCFPTTASVTLEKGKQIAMAELQVGDQVQASML